MMMKIFVCSKYSGNVEANIINVKKYCKHVLNAGCAPYAPHLYLPLILDDNDPVQRETGIFAGLAFLETCAQVWVFKTDGTISAGMQKEIEHAKKNRIPVLSFNSQMCETFHEKY